ncbi:MAG: D-alanine--D-alanine ligase [Firmicutes bacterium]|nr:D-alanine--D-alanine ligase [Bacillota bacterium]
MTLKVGVLLGGRSAEREVSLRTGEAVYQALLAKGYQAVKIDVGFDVAERVKEENIGLAFIALHGKYGEDGTIQGLLEILDIPYTGPGVLASALAIDKVAAKKMFIYEGLPTPRFILVERRDAAVTGMDAAVLRIENEIGLPAVIKAPTQGSTIGTSFVRRKEEIVPALELAFHYDEVALVEEMIEGREITASVLGNEDPVALPLIEITSTTGVYDYEAKYTPGMSEHIIPPGIPEDRQELVREMAVRAYRALGCRGLSRVDFMVDRQGRPYVLEVNTIPGMTATSLFPDAARAAGIEFPDLVDRLVRLALEGRH